MEKKLDIDSVSNEDSVYDIGQFPIAGPKRGEKS